jgi:large subunit ribosomal protein L10
MAKALKRFMAAELSETFQDLDGCLFVNFQGLTCEKAYDLRRSLDEKDVKLRVIHNRIAKHAFEKVGITGLDDVLKGQIAVAYGGDSPVTVSKALTEWKRKNKIIAIKGGYLAGKVLGTEEAEKLAFIPAREVLLAQVTGLFVSPISGFVNALAGVIRGLVTALKALEEKRQEGEGEKRPDGLMD